MAKGAVLQSLKTFPQWQEVQFSDPPDDHRTIQVHCAALNRRDYWITRGMYPNISLPIVLGSDLVGVVDGQKVIVNPGFEWGESEQCQSSDFHVLGLPQNGSIAEHCHVPANNIHPAPAHLSDPQAAALPLAGVTAYRAVFSHGQLKAGQKVLITGIGGGVATMCLLFAVAAGAEVYVTSSASNKIQKAIELGALKGFNYRDEKYEKSLLQQSGGIDLVIDSAGGDGFSKLVPSVNPGGKMVFYGATTGKINNLNPQIIFWRQITIQGTTMGSPRDFSEMLRFVNTHHITPVVDSIFSTDQLDSAFDRLEKNQQFGKIVVQIR